MKTAITKFTNQKSVSNGTYTLKIGYPALTLGAISELEHIVNKRQRVLEVGCGGSTIFWAKNCKNLKSFETDLNWCITVGKKIKRLKNVELKLRKNRQIIQKISQEPDNHYDIILINSNPKQTQRILMANAAVPKIKRNGYLIINNYQTFGMENFSYPPNWEVFTFDQFGYPGRGTRFCKLK